MIERRTRCILDPLGLQPKKSNLFNGPVKGCIGWNKQFASFLYESMHLELQKFMSRILLWKKPKENALEGETHLK